MDVNKAFYFFCKQKIEWTLYLPNAATAEVKAIIEAAAGVIVEDSHLAGKITIMVLIMSGPFLDRSLSRGDRSLSRDQSRGGYWSLSRDRSLSRGGYWSLSRDRSLSREASLSRGHQVREC